MRQVTHHSPRRPPPGGRTTLPAVRLATVLGAIGRTFITLGVLILLFVAYQLWGTGIREAQAQRALEDEFEEQLADASLNPSPVSDGSAASGESASAPSTTT